MLSNDDFKCSHLTGTQNLLQKEKLSAKYEVIKQLSSFLKNGRDDPPIMWDSKNKTLRAVKSLKSFSSGRIINGKELKRPYEITNYSTLRQKSSEYTNYKNNIGNIKNAETIHNYSISNKNIKYFKPFSYNVTRKLLSDDEETNEYDSDHSQAENTHKKIIKTQTFFDKKLKEEQIQIASDTV